MDLHRLLNPFLNSLNVSGDHGFGRRGFLFGFDFLMGQLGILGAAAGKFGFAVFICDHLDCLFFRAARRFFF
jgi:hypothetical protein